MLPGAMRARSKAKLSAILGDFRDRGLPGLISQMAVWGRSTSWRLRGQVLSVIDVWRELSAPDIPPLIDAREAP